MIDIKRANKAFDEYVKKYDPQNLKILLKINHIKRVSEISRRYATELGLGQEDIELAELIGLLHDIGRFEQIKLYGDCSDVKTGVDHADQSCIYLFDEGHIKDFYDKEDYYQIIKDSIKNHNKYVIDNEIKDKSLFFTKMIRDIDKIDIFQVLSENYTYVFDKNEISEHVLDAFNQKLTLDSHLKQSKTDAIYSYFAFLYDINFKESFEILKDYKSLDHLCSIITPKDDSIIEYNELKNKMYLYIEERLRN